MAKALGYKDSSEWSRVETGDTEMTLTMLWRAADRLGTSPAALVKMADDLTEDLARERM
jgi:transcriptional regulator with XRE-family HTH domain